MISDFRVCDSSTLDSLHRTYCMHMYGCELWDLNCKYVSEFKVAWQKMKRRIWGLPYNNNNNNNNNIYLKSNIPKSSIDYIKHTM